MDNATQTIRRGIDVLDFLSRVVQSNTEFYQSDFNYDIAALQNATREHGIADRSFCWMSRRSGTWCLKEREIFLRDTSAFSTWTYYETTTAGIQAYRIAVTGCREGTVIGDIFPLNYTDHVRRVKQNALSIQFITASFEDGSIMYTALAPLPLASFAGEGTAASGKAFLKSYVGVCMEGAVIVLACLIYTAFLSSGGTPVDTTLPAVTMVWEYIGELVFNMLVLTGLVKGASRIAKEMFGL